MAAWNVTHSWNPTLVQKYCDYTAHRAPAICAGRENLDCADLCLKILVEAAKGHGLPLRIEAMVRGDYRIFAPADSRWTWWMDFQTQLLDEVEANEVASGRGANYGNTLRIPVSAVRAGDMLAHGNRATGAFGHIQLVVSSTLASQTFAGPPTSGRAEIYQGNLEWGGMHRVPTPVQHAWYWFEERNFWYRREGEPRENAKTMWRNRNITAVRWNFEQFNVRD